MTMGWRLTAAVDAGLLSYYSQHNHIFTAPYKCAYLLNYISRHETPVV